MQIGIDLGATKIEYVLLDNNNKELERNRSETPKDFAKTTIVINPLLQYLSWNIENHTPNPSIFWEWHFALSKQHLPSPQEPNES